MSTRKDEYLVGVDEMAVIFSRSLVVDIPCSESCNLIYTILTSDSWKGSIVWLPHVN